MTIPQYGYSGFNIENLTVLERNRLTLDEIRHNTEVGRLAALLVTQTVAVDSDGTTIGSPHTLLVEIDPHVQHNDHSEERTYFSTIDRDGNRVLGDVSLDDSGKGFDRLYGSEVALFFADLNNREVSEAVEAINPITAQTDEDITKFFDSPNNNR